MTYPLMQADLNIIRSVKIKYIPYFGSGVVIADTPFRVDAPAARFGMLVSDVAATCAGCILNMSTICIVLWQGYIVGC